MQQGYRDCERAFDQ